MSLCSDQREDGESTSGSSEAKTDRYGFLLVNGDTNNDSDDPCPELVRHREMKWITLMNQWDQVLEKKHSKIKAQCQKGIPASVRARCWPLLCGAKQRKENNQDLYKTLESSPGQQSWIDVIKRDTDRQFPFHEMFQSKDSHGQQGLLQVLKAYTQFRPDEGYCQAQGPVAAVLLMNMPIEEAFWCLVQISELYLPGYYSPLLEGVLFDAAILFSVLKRTCPAAYKHMKRQGVEPLMFATDWLMCLYSRHLPFNTLLRVWDLFFCNGVRVLFQVAVVLVRRCLGEARHRKECDGQMETLERLRSVRGRVQHEQADAFIQEVCSVPLSLAELQRLTEKELEKWRKERPGSTFDPRDRCHGHYIIWEKGKEREKENVKKERQSGNLSVSVMRSHSSLSPAILRKKWRKRGSKTETEEWEGRGSSKQDSDDEEKRRASVCGVAGELRAKTHKTPQEFSTNLQKDRNTTPNTARISAAETQNRSESTDHSDTVFEEDENDAAVITVPSHTDSGEYEEETRPPSGSKDDDLQTGNCQQEIEKQHGTETRQDEEKKVQTPGEDQDEEIQKSQERHETQQAQSQPSQLEEEEAARNILEDETQENRSEQEEEIENKSCKPEEEVQLNISTQKEDVNITLQEVEPEVNTDTQEQEIHICTCEQELENGMNSKHEEEMQISSSKQEEEIVTNSQEQEEIHLVDSEEINTAIGNKQEKEIKTNRREQEVEIQEEREIKAKSSEQEVEIQEEREIKANSSEQEVEIQEENEIKANSSEQEVEIQEENEIKANSSEQEVEIQEENEIKANSSEQEVEIQEENEIKANSSEQEVEIQEENEIKANSSEQEVEIQEENEIKANSSEQEVEIQNEDRPSNSDDEEEKLKKCLVHEDVPRDGQKQQEDSEQTNEVEQSLETGEEMHSNIQTPEDQKDAEEQAPSVQEEDHVKGELCESVSSTDVKRTQQEQEGETEHSEEMEKEARISDAAPGEETEGTVMDEEKRSSNNLTADQEESETAAASPCVQPEIVMEHSGDSETPQDSNQTQGENIDVNKISTSEHGEPDGTSGSSNPELPQPDNEEEESKIEINIATESNLVKPALSGSNPQLRLRRSSSSHTYYPTILSEDTFRDPQQCVKQESCPQTTKAEESDIAQPTQTQLSKQEEGLQKPQTQALPKSEKPKRRGLFHRLRADTPSKSAIPKIVIQDFSEGEEKLSSKERRRRRRMQERKEKEEEKERKKLEKELEKEKGRERKKPQTRGKSFQVLSRKQDDDDNDVFSGKSGSQTVGRKRNSYSESYF
ncbi:ecotropic viral integration site 5 ortholog isoform X2 [Ictalurus punctatus]|uniref:Ecotropic viral integration site 5 ortholog isoform X2 n=1 Tax=Ictalurus punctatus TaxID=7998 RepID=A0A2D0RFJ9_ICTPU|nr:ecotropic viral integration site 5 ortholog isoform X2 [Ictalurus punctatus]